MRKDSQEEIEEYLKTEKGEKDFMMEIHRFPTYKFVNHILIKKLGPLPAIYYSLLLNLSEVYEEKNERTRDDFFCADLIFFKQKIKFSHRQQNFCIKKLVEKNLIKVEMFGTPPKRHILTIHKNLIEMLIEEE